MKTILFVTGTISEISKIAPVYLKFSELKPFINLLWYHTGQHDEVARAIFDQFDIAPDIVLDRTLGRGHGDYLGEAVQSIERIVDWYKPHLVMAYGDSIQTLAAALAAFHRSTPFAHIGAGLRSAYLDNINPKESSRRIIGTIACRHYAPTPRAAENLQREGVDVGAINVAGDTVVDAQRLVRVKMAMSSLSRDKILVSVQRRENWPSIRNLCRVLQNLAREYPSINFVVPLHPNPSVSSVVIDTLADVPNILLSDPLGYLELQRCLSEAFLAITDSGRILEEAPGFNVPCIVLRETTERPESIECGLAVLAGIDGNAIEKHVRHWLTHPQKAVGNPFGDGHAATRIWKDVKDFLSLPEPIKHLTEEVMNA